MSKTKSRYLTAALFIAIFCIAAAWGNRDQCWKLFSQTINTKQFEAISQSHDAFVGMKIADVLHLVAKTINALCLPAAAPAWGCPMKRSLRCIRK